MYTFWFCPYVEYSTQCLFKPIDILFRKTARNIVELKAKLISAIFALADIILSCLVSISFFISRKMYCLVDFQNIPSSKISFDYVF